MMLTKTKTAILLSLRQRRLRNVDLAKELGVSRSSVSQCVKELQKLGMVKKGSKIELTNIGRIVADQISLLDRNLSFFSRNPEFWNSYDLASVPPHLLHRISDLRNSEIVESRAEFFAYLRRFFQLIPPDAMLKAVLSVIPPDVVCKRVEEVIVPKGLVGLAEKLRCRVHVVDNLRLFCLLAEDAICIAFHLTSGEFDAKAGLVSKDEAAVVWGAELFESLKVQSELRWATGKE